MRFDRVFLLLTVAGAISYALPARAQVEPARKTESQDEFVNVTGEAFHLPNAGQCRGIVLFFAGYDCPISNAYSKELTRIYDEFSPKKISFCVVYADADLSRENAAKHAREYAFHCPAVLDPKMTLALKVGATIKSEVAVLSPKGEVLYRGRIDNRYVDFGRRREQVTAHELRDALDAIVAGKPISVLREKAIGCDIDLPHSNK